MYVDIAPGLVVCDHNGKRLVIIRVADAESVDVHDPSTQQTSRLPIETLRPASVSDAPARAADLVDDEAFQVAYAQYLQVEPFLEQTRLVASELQRVATESFISVRTLRRRISKFRLRPVVTALLRERRSDRGVVRLDPAVEAIVQKNLKTRYLDGQQRSVRKCHTEITLACRSRRLTPPSYGTIRARVFAIDPYLATKSREGENQALKRREVRGTIPGADYPYAVLQIDHTQVDVILVDDEHRLPLGKPWLTLAIDVYSRVIAGLYVAFETPGTLGTGLCITNAMLSKRDLLNRLQMSEVSYPCQGKPHTIHVDNAREFRGKDLERACMQHGIHLKFRPIKKPQYGAYIERMMGTLAKEIAALPGTTFGDHDRREAYDSENKAAMTLSEFERWLGNLLFRTYHHRVHSGIGMPPLVKYRQSLVGADGDLGPGTIRLAADPAQLRLDFMPTVVRSIQTEGVVADKIHYYDDVLRRWVGSRDPANLKNARQFVFKRDPRDISKLWFLDPDLEQYFPINYRKRERPPMSLWELRAVQAYLRTKGREGEDEDEIFRGYEEMLSIETASIRATKAARVAAGKRKARAQKVRAEGVATLPVTQTTSDSTSPSGVDDILIGGETFTEIVRR